MEHKNFERELPKGYKQTMYIDARNVLVGIVLNLVTLLITGVALVLALLPIAVICGDTLRDDDGNGVIALIAGVAIGVFVFLPFVVVHELIHGWAYKRKTGEKLTFGISWSCAYCGVPGIYTYRATALYALLAPMVVLSAIFVVGMVVCLALTSAFAVGSSAHKALLLIYGTLASTFAFHLGGCCGDAYIALLFAFKYRDPATLMRDTGPEQFVFVPDTEYAASTDITDRDQD